MEDFQLVLSAIMGIVCIGLIIFLYIFSGGWKSHGGLSGLWRWLSQGGLSNPNVRSKQGPTKRIPDASEVTEIMEEIYREFTDKLYKQNEDLQEKFAESLSELRQVVQSLENRLSILEKSVWIRDVMEDPIEQKSITIHKEESITQEPVYFRILDELRKGRSPEKVASRLGVTIHDVNEVLNIMETPGNKN
jgi:translation initiation factor 2 beta subunit (eIF-2beta)/eIF-5